MAAAFPARVLRSSTFRVALMYMALFGLSVLLLLGVIWWNTAGYMSRQADAAIEAEIEGLAERYRGAGLLGLSRTIRDRIEADPRRSSVYLLLNPEGERVVGNLSGWPRAPEQGSGWIDFELKSLQDGEVTEHAARARLFVLRGDFRLLVGRDLDELEAVQKLILEALIIGLLLMAVLGLAGGLWLSRRVLRRIEAINATSREIMAGQLHRRIPSRGGGDDFDQLGDHLNAMLDRIEDLMVNVRQVSDNIAHDLKTPLGRLRVQLEMLHERLKGCDREAEAMAEQAIAEADGLLSTFSALLRIARVESGERRAGFGPVDLSRVVADVEELYGPLAEEKGLRLVASIEPGVQMTGDRDLLFQAVANLLDNAVKYSPACEEVRLQLLKEGGQAVIRVSDGGPGIPEKERDKVLRRFYRLEASRSTPGNGLGLSLVQAVVGLHEGRLGFGDNEPGLVVTLYF